MGRFIKLEKVVFRARNPVKGPWVDQPCIRFRRTGLIFNKTFVTAYIGERNPTDCSVEIFFDTADRRLGLKIVPHGPSAYKIQEVAGAGQSFKINSKPILKQFPDVIDCTYKCLFDSDSELIEIDLRPSNLVKE